MLGGLWGMIDAFNWDATADFPDQKGDMKHEDPVVSRMVQDARDAGEKLYKPGQQLNEAFQGIFSGKVDAEKWGKSTKAKITRYTRKRSLYRVKIEIIKETPVEDIDLEGRRHNLA